eukprot:g9409.t1
MSFGFLTESALLPAKSKPIKVDGRSLVDLKAIVYAKEQKVKLDGGGGSGSGGLRGLRGRRPSSGDKANARKDPFARRNKGVEDRSEQDEVERVTASKKRKAAERVMAAKSSLYEKMAKGEVCGASRAGSLVDFSRKTGADLALLEAKAGKPKKRKDKGDGKPGSGVGDASSSSNKKRRRGSGSEDLDLSDDDYDDDNDATGGDVGGSEVEIMDEFGRHRIVTRGGAEHREHLQAKRRAAELKAEQESQRKAAAAAGGGGASSSFDERYSACGNIGRGGERAAASAPSYYGPSSSSSSAADAGGGGAAARAWAWSSGAGRGADEGDFETREGQERRAKKDMTELLEREGAGEILSQWEKTLSGDQKSFLREVQQETEARRKEAASATTAAGAGLTIRDRQRAERKELLRRKQEARAARLRAGDT